MNNKYTKSLREAITNEKIKVSQEVINQEIAVTKPNIVPNSLVKNSLLDNWLIHVNNNYIKTCKNFNKEVTTYIDNLIIKKSLEEICLVNLEYMEKLNKISNDSFLTTTSLYFNYLAKLISTK